MRLTTKIIIGIILSIFLLSLVFIIAFSFTDRRHYEAINPNAKVDIPQEHKTVVKLASYRAIVFETEQTDLDNPYFYLLNSYNGLFVNPITTADAGNELIFPEELSDFVAVQANNDTLAVKIRIDEIRKKYLKTDETKNIYHKGILMGIPCVGLNLHLATSNVNVINRVSGLPIEVANFDTDSILVNSTGDVDILSCKVNFIKPVIADNKYSLHVRQSDIHTMNIDLDSVDFYRFENCNIEVINYSSNRTRYINFDDKDTGKVKTVNWLPKKPKVELNISFKGKTSFQFHQ